MAFEMTDADKIGMTPDEIASLTADNVDGMLLAHGAETAAVEEKEGVEAEADPVAAVVDEPVVVAAANADDAPTLSAEDLVDLLDEANQQTVAQAPLPFKVEGVKDFKAQRQALRAEAAAVEEKWKSGELSDDERTTELERIEDAKDDLLVANTRAETLREANLQTAANAKESFNTSLSAACSKIAVESKASGLLDYAADKSAALRFDHELTLLMADPDTANKRPAELAVLAHKNVLAVRGLTKPVAVPVAQPQAPAARRNAPTVTLSGLPNAAPTQMEGEALDKFSNLEGEDAENYLASLPKQEQDRILRAADAGSMTHRNDARSGRRAARA